MPVYLLLVTWLAPLDYVVGCTTAGDCMQHTMVPSAVAYAEAATAQTGFSILVLDRLQLVSRTKGGCFHGRKESACAALPASLLLALEDPGS